jgi:UDP-2-acetamido-2,6-beta-L-arabino-hexul-4-ose reductase
MKVLITGADGFIGRNLCQHLSERPDVELVAFTRADPVAALDEKLVDVDFVFHLAGVNRPQHVEEFEAGNSHLTLALSNAVRQIASATGRAISVVFTSSIQATRDNPYGDSKRAAEEALWRLAQNGASVHIFRLPNVFGKWSRPNYNSVVSTFCHNIARDLPIQVSDPRTPLTLVYVDDVIAAFVRLMDGASPERDADGFAQVSPQYDTTVGELARQVEAFRDSRQSLVTERVGAGLVRALYATYVSYLPTERFSYTVAQHGDPRGVFVEMLKTPDSGQFSYFTAGPGITRGGHYHHTKTEKFLVIRGAALFKFRHIQTAETYELRTNGNKAEIVETVPGWTHDITNIGDDEMIVMLWANEIFDRARPDTFACAV